MIFFLKWDQAMVSNLLALSFPCAPMYILANAHAQIELRLEWRQVAVHLHNANIIFSAVFVSSRPLHTVTKKIA